LTAEQVTLVQLNALQDNDKPYPDHGIEVMYRVWNFSSHGKSVVCELLSKSSSVTLEMSDI